MRGAAALKYDERASRGTGVETKNNLNRPGRPEGVLEAFAVGAVDLS